MTDRFTIKTVTAVAERVERSMHKLGMLPDDAHLHVSKGSATNGNDWYIYVPPDRGTSIFGVRFGRTAKDCQTRLYVIAQALEAITGGPSLLHDIGRGEISRCDHAFKVWYQSPSKRDDVFRALERFRQ